MKKVLLLAFLFSVCLLVGCSVALADTNTVTIMPAGTTNAAMVLPTAEVVPTQAIPTFITSILGPLAPFIVGWATTLYTLGIALKPFMASFQHGINDRLAFSIDILGTDADIRNRKLLSAAWYRTLAYWADLLLRLKLPTIDGYLAQLKAQSTPGTEPQTTTTTTLPPP